MQSLQKGMEDLSCKLNVAEMAKADWLPINDINLDQMPAQLAQLKVSFSSTLSCSDHDIDVDVM